MCALEGKPSSFHEMKVQGAHFSVLFLRKPTVSSSEEVDLFRFVLSFARLNVCDVRRLASTRGISLWNQANLPDFHEILQSRQKILWLKKKNFPSVKYVNFSLYEQSAAHTRTSQGNLKRFGPCLRLPESTTKSTLQLHQGCLRRHLCGGDPLVGIRDLQCPEVPLSISHPWIRKRPLGD